MSLTLSTSRRSLSFQKEIESLKGKLAEVESWKARLHDIDLELHFKA